MNSLYCLIETSWQESEPQLKSIRRCVFIDEQQVPEELEWDKDDQTSCHILVTDNNNLAIATGRLKANGHIGRMAVLIQYRDQGIGSSVLNTLMERAKKDKISRLYLHAQLSAIDFYLKHGFTVYSETFMDAGIAHKSMQLIFHP